MRRVLITGASGFLGSYCFEALRKRDFNVVLTSRKDPRFDFGRATFHRCNLTREDETAALLNATRPTHLLHLAWYAEPGAFWQSTENIDALAYSLRLANAFVASGGKHISAVGSCAEYKERDASEGRYREDAALTDSTLYAATKNAFHRVAEKLSIDSSTPLAWGRVFYVFGPHESPRKFVSSTALALLRGETVTLSQPQRRLDYVHARDVGEAFAALVDGDANGSFNIGSGAAATPLEIATIIASYLGVPNSIRTSSGPTGHDIVADRANIRDFVGWEPQQDLVAAIEELVGELARDSRTRP